MSVDLGLLILRVFLGGFLMAHGAQKLFGWFGGHGIKGTTQFMGQHFRLRPAGIWTWLAALSEFGGGLLVVLGLLGPLGSLGIIAAMLMAIILGHPNHFFAQNRGMEYPLFLLVAAVTLAITGPGAYSLDNWFGLALPAPATFIVGLVLVLAGVGLALATREPLPQASEQPDRTPQQVA
jgi:putative oxidoreductase